jgi:hypothetical protein
MCEEEIFRLLDVTVICWNYSLRIRLVGIANT